jgi:murein DD-endopeptidase MepM/ murein hydrolase activator NlpD
MRRPARKAAAPLTTALLLAATLNASFVVVAHATDSTGGISAPTAPPTAQPASTTEAGGTGASAGTTTDAAGSGGAVAPSTKGTGGSEYGVVMPKPRASRKPPRTPPRQHPTPKSKAAPSKPSKPVPPKPAPLVAAGAPTPAQTASEGAVFPVIGPHSFGDAANRFGASRAGHIHEGQDVLASEGLEVVAPLAGTIITTTYQAGGAGWYAAEHTGDGLDFFFAHCQTGSLAVSTGEAVHAGQALCKVGQTGDATGPHLHFEVWVGGWQAASGHPIDPLPYLEAWDRT